MKVYIDPRARISYASYYIEGLYRLFGGRNIHYRAKYFRDLKQTDGIDDFDHYFAFILSENYDFKKIIVDFRDKNTINLNALNWSNLYGKVNYNLEIINKVIPGEEAIKIIPIGPNFGIKIYNDIQSLYYLITNYLKIFNTLPVPFREFMAGYNWHRRRMRYSDYLLSESKSNYVFFVSSLYPKTNDLSRTNELRAEFIRSCKDCPDVHFEGGLHANKNHYFYDKYKDIVTETYIEPHDYLKKIRKSAIVFNTPAFWNCHGWKLGEFFAMGKAIISTPLSNSMPYPLEHGKHIHFVNSISDIRDAICKLVEDSNYRKQLEEGSKWYFQNFLAPEIMIKQLMKESN